MTEDTDDPKETDLLLGGRPPGEPAPGVLLPRRTVTERRRRDIRFLAGAHDAVAFVADSDCDARQVVRAFHAEISGRQGLAEHG